MSIRPASPSNGPVASTSTAKSPKRIPRKAIEAKQLALTTMARKDSLHDSGSTPSGELSSDGEPLIKRQKKGNGNGRSKNAETNGTGAARQTGKARAIVEDDEDDEVDDMDNDQGLSPDDESTGKSKTTASGPVGKGGSSAPSKGKKKSKSPTRRRSIDWSDDDSVAIPPLTKKSKAKKVDILPEESPDPETPLGSAKHQKFARLDGVDLAAAPPVGKKRKTKQIEASQRQSTVALPEPVAATVAPPRTSKPTLNKSSNSGEKSKRSNLEPINTNIPAKTNQVDLAALSFSRKVAPASASAVSSVATPKSSVISSTAAATTFGHATSKAPTAPFPSFKRRIGGQDTTALCWSIDIASKSGFIVSDQTKIDGLLQLAQPIVINCKDEANALLQFLVARNYIASEPGFKSEDLPNDFRGVTATISIKNELLIEAITKPPPGPLDDRAKNNLTENAQFGALMSLIRAIFTEGPHLFAVTADIYRNLVDSRADTAEIKKWMKGMQQNAPIILGKFKQQHPRRKSGLIANKFRNIGEKLFIQYCDELVQMLEDGMLREEDTEDSEGSIKLGFGTWQGEVLNDIRRSIKEMIVFVSRNHDAYIEKAVATISRIHQLCVESQGGDDAQSLLEQSQQEVKDIFEIRKAEYDAQGQPMPKPREMPPPPRRRVSAQPMLLHPSPEPASACSSASTQSPIHPAYSQSPMGMSAHSPAQSPAPSSSIAARADVSTTASSHLSRDPRLRRTSLERLSPTLSSASSSVPARRSGPAGASLSPVCIDSAAIFAESAQATRIGTPSTLPSVASNGSALGSPRSVSPIATLIETKRSEIMPIQRPPQTPFTLPQRPSITDPTGSPPTGPMQYKRTSLSLMQPTKQRQPVAMTPPLTAAPLRSVSASLPPLETARSASPAPLPLTATSTLDSPTVPSRRFSAPIEPSCEPIARQPPTPRPSPGADDRSRSPSMTPAPVKGQQRSSVVETFSGFVAPPRPKKMLIEGPFFSKFMFNIIEPKEIPTGWLSRTEEFVIDHPQFLEDLKLPNFDDSSFMDAAELPSRIRCVFRKGPNYRSDDARWPRMMTFELRTFDASGNARRHPFSVPGISRDAPIQVQHAMDITRYVEFARNELVMAKVGGAELPEGLIFSIEAVRSFSSRWALKQIDRHDADDIHNLYNEWAERSKEEDGTVTLRLDDPTTGKKIVTPVRGRSCRHLETFDFETVLIENEKSGQWTCPFSDLPHVTETCNQSFDFQDLTICAYMESVLEQTKGSDLLYVDVRSQSDDEAGEDVKPSVTA